MKEFWDGIHPKIKAVAISAVIIAVISIGNAIINVYPDQAWTPILASTIGVLVGYTKASNNFDLAKAGTE